MSKCLVLFVEGDTEVEFYKQVVANARKLHPAGRFDTNIEYRNVRGVGGFKSIALRKFIKEIKPKYDDDCEFTIVLCSDTDVFDFAPKPPIKWDEVKKELTDNGVSKIIHIQAKRSIEDWFFYDKGIPDNPFYISLGKSGQSVQYFPEFEEEHWMRHYWFNHFADAVYMKLFSVWDSVTEILDTFYGMGIDKNMRFKFRVMDKLKEINPALWGFLKNDVLGVDIYQTAEQYRNSFAHYSGPSSVSNSYKIERNKEMTFPEMQEDGSVKMVTKKVTAFSCGVGEYTYVENIMNNLLEFSKFTGDSIQKMLVDMVSR